MLQMRHVSLQNCYRYFVSDYDAKQYEKTFFSKTSCFDFWSSLKILRRQLVVQLG